MTDHETALAGGFDIVEAGLWTRPDSVTIERRQLADFDQGVYFAWRDVLARPAIFYTMREAVEWIGPPWSDDPEPRCDICGRLMEDSPAGFADADWNGETGNHETCEEIAEGNR